MIKTLVVDDEAEARKGICLLLEQDPEITLLGASKNGLEAIEHIQELAPDLLFLDIQMPKINGFEVLNSLPPSRVPLVVFVTAFDQYALRAFEIHAIDYLLKPFTDQRFFHCLEHAKQSLKRESQHPIQQLLENYLHSLPPRKGSELLPPSGSGLADRLIIKSSGKIFFLPYPEIIWIEACDYYVTIHLKDQHHLVRESMKSMEARLPESHFARIHKSSMVNLHYVDRLEPFFNGEYTVHLRDGQKLKLSRGYKDRMWKRLGY